MTTPIKTHGERQVDHLYNRADMWLESQDEDRTVDDVTYALVEDLTIKLGKHIDKLDDLRRCITNLTKTNARLRRQIKRPT